MERIEMSGKEVKRLEVLRQVSDGVVTQGMAAQVLNLTVRQVRRLQRRYEGAGAAGLVSGRRGQGYDSGSPTGMPWGLWADAGGGVFARRGAGGIERDLARLDD